MAMHSAYECLLLRWFANNNKTPKSVITRSKTNKPMERKILRKIKTKSNKMHAYVPYAFKLYSIK